MAKTEYPLGRWASALVFISMFAGIGPSMSLAEEDAPIDPPASVNAPQPVSKIIQFGIDHGNLATRTALRPTPYMRPIEVTDMPGSTRVDVRMRSRRDRPAMALYFRLNHTEPGEAQGDSTTTTLYSRPGYIEITQAAQTGDVVLTTTFTQMPENNGASGEGEEDVVLKIRRLDTSTSRVVEETTISAPSLVALLREHPRESAEFLAPIFRTFHQEEEIMAVDLQSSWQVLAGLMKADDSMRPAVASIVARLGADDFRAREAALADLHKLGGKAALLLMKWNRRDLAPEQISKIEFFLRTFAPLTPDEAAAKLNDPDFLLTCIAYSEDSGLRSAASKKLPDELRKEGFAAAQTDVSLERLTLVARLRKNLPPRDDDIDAD